VVCADKTGTLTENGMRLSEVRPLFAGFDAAEVLAAFAAADPRPNASLQAVLEAHPSPPDWPVTAFAAFSSARKWSGASFGDSGNWVLGAADVLLPRASAALVAAEELGAQGLRVLLLARASVPVDSADAPGEVEPMALVVLAQRVRPDAGETLEYFADQGVTVKVISGDNAVAVGAVAASLGLVGASGPVDARQLPASLGDAVEEGTVFGRVTPAQKRDMVGALQARGHTVAMTGDGVNDVLALKDADIGVAMGSGSPATRAVAQIVLLDDRFATLPFVVAEGRRVIGNVERVANLFLVKTVYSVLLAILIGVVGFPFPFQPLHLTLIGGLTIGIPAFFLALAPNGDRARDGFVRRVLRLAVPVGAVAAVATFTAYWTSRAVDNGTTAAQDSTTAVITLFVIALWVLGVVARPLVWWKIALVATMAALFLLALLVPFGQSFFELDPSNAASVSTALVTSLVAVSAIEFIRRLMP
ncbi:MAG TPA: HAD-IC family P-type ATPase, partial [Umezawaea sp.]|nr:HAD-IC family P-type ATPase [Umezawaea sp.]